MQQRAFMLPLIGLGALIILALLIYKTITPTPIAQGSMLQGTFGEVTLNVELATTTAAREKGLGGRTSLAPDYGMLFVFSHDDLYGFWMKDTLVPLDMFWLDAKGQVVYIAHDVSPDTYNDANPRLSKTFISTVPARYVLETEAGFAERHGIATGTPLLLQTWPTVSE